LITLYQGLLLIVVPNLEHIFLGYTDPRTTTFSKRIRISVISPTIHNVRGFDFEFAVSLGLIEISLGSNLIAPLLLVSMTFERGQILKAAVIEV